MNKQALAVDLLYIFLCLKNFQMGTCLLFHQNVGHSSIYNYLIFDRRRPTQYHVILHLPLHSPSIIYELSGFPNNKLKNSSISNAS